MTEAQPDGSGGGAGGGTTPPGRKDRPLLSGVLPVPAERVQPERADVDGLGQRRVEARAGDGTLLHTCEDGRYEENTAHAAFPLDTPAGAAALPPAAAGRETARQATEAAGKELPLAQPDAAALPGPAAGRG
ncbi:hypothetical protein WDH52_22905 [Streptomyces sp. TRM70308]|uniref:hypothetical protein n=1 Tax=Streptomyces sp. TRM70308 TaxID=3131932 RepID=UPI003D07B63F